MKDRIIEALVANASMMIAGAARINKATLLASKSQKCDVKVGLRVLAEAGHTGDRN